MDQRSQTPPRGRLDLRQTSGRWSVIEQLSPVPGDHDRGRQSVANTVTRIGRLPDGASVKAHVAGDAICWELAVLPTVELSSLTACASPLTPDRTARIVRAIGACLKQLHSVGIGAFDLCPARVFVDRDFVHAALIPSPWIPDHKGEPAPDITWMPFVAPEVATESEPNAIAADIYGLGALAWFLLTGRKRQRGEVTFPSEVSADLSGWDQFIDGCCRSNPSRRFQSIDAALKSMPCAVTNSPAGAPSVSPVQPLPIPSKKPGYALLEWSLTQIRASTGTTFRRVIVVFACLLVCLLGAWVVASVFGLSRSYTRGFADTIITYKDRSYEGAKWKQAKSAEALRTIVQNDCLQFDIRGIAGWDDDSYWVIGQGGKVGHGAYVFKKIRGEWSAHGGVEDEFSGLEPQNLWWPRLLSSEQCLVASTKRILDLNSQGTRTICQVEGGDLMAVCPISPDLFYAFLEKHVYKVADGKGHHLRGETHKEVYVHREDNTPLKEYIVGYTCFCASFLGDRVIGLCAPDFADPVIAEYRNGLWYRVMSIDWKNLNRPDRHGFRYVRPNKVWFGGGSSQPQFAVIVGNGGTVLVCQIEKGEVIDQSVEIRQTTSSLDLVAVWGKNLNKYWVMDNSGTIWERTDRQWRVVVRGLLTEDVEFLGAWVSPTGKIVAFTKDYLYELD